MPLVEIGIPPAFAPETEDLDALMSRAGAQRVASEPGKVTLYFVALAEDKPLAFEFRLRALRPERVVAPPSAAYLYYEPEVRAETGPMPLRSL